jgi:hypothetical protein
VPICRRLAILAAAMVAAFGGSHVAPVHAYPAAVAKSCSRGYVLAHLSWGVKCLRAGEFCKIGNHEYLRYGFVCPSSGHLRRR